MNMVPRRKWPPDPWPWRRPLRGGRERRDPLLDGARAVGACRVDSLARFPRLRGVVPAAVAGHGAGRIVAARRIAQDVPLAVRQEGNVAGGEDHRSAPPSRGPGGSARERVAVTSASVV